MYTDDGIIYQIDRRQVIGFASLAKANLRLTTELNRLDARFDAATEQILIQMRTIEDQNTEIDMLRSEIIRLSADRASTITP